MAPAIPRLAFDELPDTLQSMLRSKYERLGYLGEFFAATAHQEQASRAFIEFTEAAKGSLPDNLVEVIVLTIATHYDVDYEKNQHERLCLKLGFTKDWIRDVEALSPESAHELSKEEQELQRFVIDGLSSNGRDSVAQLDTLVDSLGVDNSVAVLMVCGRYIAHSFMVNALDIKAPVASIFDEI